VRVLLDECVPRKLRRLLVGHEVKTVSEMGWSGIKNGTLLRRAAGRFDVFATVDQGIEHQQDLSGVNLAVIVMIAKSNAIDDLQPLVAGVLVALKNASPGRVVRVKA
jgi:Domain of unknown function (DUF5615)